MPRMRNGSRQSPHPDPFPGLPVWRLRHGTPLARRRRSLAGIAARSPIQISLLCRATMVEGERARMGAQGVRPGRPRSAARRAATRHDAAACEADDTGQQHQHFRTLRPCLPTSPFQHRSSSAPRTAEFRHSRCAWSTGPIAATSWPPGAPSAAENRRSFHDLSPERGPWRAIEIEALEAQRYPTLRICLARPALPSGSGQNRPEPQAELSTF